MNAEQDLLHKARQWETQALAQIYDQYSPGLYRYALRLLGDPSAAEDCVAETFRRFLQALQEDHGPRDYLQAYLYRIAHNLITDHYRRQPLEELEDHFPDGEEPIEEIASRRIRQHKVRAALCQLTPDQQQVIALKFLGGWENEAIARALHKPVGAVKSLQHRALERLKQILLEEAER